MRKVYIQQIETYEYLVDDKTTNDQAYDQLLEAWNDGTLDTPDDVDINFVTDELLKTYIDIQQSQNTRIELLEKIANQLLKKHNTIQEITIVPQNNYSFMVKTNSQTKFIPTKSTEELNREIEKLLESEKK